MPVGDLIRRHAHDPASSARTFLRFGDHSFTFGEYHRECCRWAAMFLRRRQAGKPFHVGILLDNTPDYLFALGGAALAGAVAVGINNTKRDRHLAGDIRHTDCALLITEENYL